MKPDTTEARQLADELAADVAALLREGLPQEAMRADAAQSAIRALADERDSLRAEVAVLQMACSRWERALEHGAERVRNAENESDSLRAQVEALRSHIECDSDALLRLAVDLRWALGDKGRRMQDDLVRYAGELRADAERYRWLRARQEPSSAEADEDAEFRHGSISRIFVGTGLGHAVAHTGAELDSAIDAARSKEDAG